MGKDVLMTEKSKKYSAIIFKMNLAIAIVGFISGILIGYSSGFLTTSSYTSSNYEQTTESYYSDDDDDLYDDDDDKQETSSSGSEFNFISCFLVWFLTFIVEVPLIALCYHLDNQDTIILQNKVKIQMLMKINDNDKKKIIIKKTTEEKEKG